MKAKTSKSTKVQALVRSIRGIQRVCPEYVAASGSDTEIVRRVVEQRSPHSVTMLLSFEDGHKVSVTVSAVQ